jgi:hypothetical protein
MSYEHPWERPGYKPLGETLDGMNLVQVALIVKDHESEKLPIHVSFGQFYDGMEYTLHASATQSPVNNKLFIYTPPTPLALTGKAISLTLKSMTLNEHNNLSAFVDGDSGYDHVSERYPILPSIPFSNTLSVHGREDSNLIAVTYSLKYQCV